MVVYELWAVDAKSPEAAKAEIEKRTRKDSIIVAAESLDQLAHPVHLAEAQDKFGSTDEDG